MINKKLILMSGLPRSGSSLIQNILNQNPYFYATGTSPILNIILKLKNLYSNDLIIKSTPDKNKYDNYVNGIGGFISNYYENNKNIIFDKNRGWANNLLLFDKIVKHKNTKIIFMYRDPIEVCNSMEHLHRKTILFENIDEQKMFNYDTLEERIRRYIETGSILDRSILGLYDCLNTGYGNRCLIFPYNKFLKEPQLLMDELHNFIDEPLYKYNFNNIKQVIFEDDEVWNFKFPHNIKEGKIIKPDNKMLIPETFQNLIKQKYEAIYKIIN